MLDENVRNLLYYPLGFIPSIFFTLRFIIQWIKSEKIKKSYVDAVFWRLSITGNLLATAHYFIQFQFVFMLIQLINAFIAWRNLNLMKDSRAQFSKNVTMALCLFAVSLISILFFWQPIEPTTLELSEKQVNLSWHILGAIGGFIFASRFWVQWWNAEQHRKSTLNENFWKLSILGGILTIAYSIQIHDTVSIVNYSCGIIPYARNLMLLQRAKNN